MAMREVAHRNSIDFIAHSILFLSIYLYLSYFIRFIIFSFSFFFSSFSLFLSHSFIFLIKFLNFILVNKSTNRRVIVWFIFELLLIVALAVWQVYYLKKFFEVKRVV